MGVIFWYVFCHIRGNWSEKPYDESPWKRWTSPHCTKDHLVCCFLDTSRARLDVPAPIPLLSHWSIRHGPPFKLRISRGDCDSPWYDNSIHCWAYHSWEEGGPGFRFLKDRPGRDFPEQQRHWPETNPYSSVYFYLVNNSVNCSVFSKLALFTWLFLLFELVLFWEEKKKYI